MTIMMMMLMMLMMMMLIYLKSIAFREMTEYRRKWEIQGESDDKLGHLAEPFAHLHVPVTEHHAYAVVIWVIHHVRDCTKASHGGMEDCQHAFVVFAQSDP
jgi:hypothetical protein